MRWFRRKPEPTPDEIVLVDYGGKTFREVVYRDADDRPYCIVCDSALRLDEPSGRQIIWLKRRPSPQPAEPK